MNDVPLHIRAQAELELRRRYLPPRKNLLPFIRTTKPGYLAGWFHQKLCDALDRFLCQVREGKQPRLMVVAPPQHGKSEIVSRRFPAYGLGQYPDLRFISCSYGSDLATRMNRDVQRIIDDPIYRRVFPGTRLHGQNISTLSGQPLRNSSIFEIVDHLGSYRGAGVGQGITGMGFDIGIIDDPVKDSAQANSEVERNAIWEWYETTFYSRASPLSGILLVMTRWHEDDLAGRLLHKMQFEGGDQWEVIRFPALAEEDEEFRKEGEALHPERYSQKRLEQFRAVMGSYAFGALYQGRPTPKGGGIITRDDFRFYRQGDLASIKLDMVVLSIDAAFKDAANSSYVVLQAWGRSGINHYLLGQVRKRLTFSKTVEAIRKMKQDYPAATAVLIEDKANGTAIIDTLCKEIPGVIAIEPSGSKPARAEAVSPLIEAGNVWLPHPDESPWVETFIHEWVSVPTGAFWDQVDASDQYLLKYGRSIAMNLSTGVEVVPSLVSLDESGSPWEM